MNELDYMDNITLVSNNDMITVNQYNNVNDINNMFGFSQDINGNINITPDEPTNKDIDEIINSEINNSVDKDKDLLNKIHKNNDTKLSDQELLSLYKQSSGGNGMIVF